MPKSRLLIIALVFAAIFTFPFILRLTTYYSDNSDYSLIGWILWYNQFAIKTGGILEQTTYFSANQFSFHPYSFAFTEYLFVPSLFFTPLYWLTQNIILSTNSLAFLTFVLSFFFSFLFIHFFVKDTYASIVGALIYTFNPLTFAHFPDHLNLVIKFFLPMVFLYAYQFFKKPKWSNALLFALFFILNSLSVVYFQIFTIFLLPIFAIPFLILNTSKKNIKYFFELLKKGVIIALISLPILLYFNNHYLMISKKEGAIRVLQEKSHYSARFVDWASPHPENIIYKSVVKTLDPLREPREAGGEFNYSEHTLFLNILPTILFVIGLLLFLKKNKGFTTVDSRLQFYSFTLLLIVSFILTFGPFLEDIRAIKLPFYYVYKFTPIFDGIRVPTRFQFAFYIPFALFAAYGFGYLQRKLRIKTRQKFFLFLLSFFIIFVENVNAKSYLESSKIYPQVKNYQDRDSKLIKLLKGESTVHYPLYKQKELSANVQYLLWSSITEERLFNGYAGYIPSDWTSFISVRENLDVSFLEKLYLLNLQYLVIHKDLYEQGGDEYMYMTDKIDGEFAKQIVFEDKDIAVIDLKQFGFDATVCERDKADIDYTVRFPYFIFFGSSLESKLSIKNNDSCYLVNTGHSRYVRSDTRLDNKKYTHYFKLPLIIEPDQEFIASSEIKRIKNRFDYISTGLYHGKTQVQIGNKVVRKEFELTVHEF